MKKVIHSLLDKAGFELVRSRAPEGNMTSDGRLVLAPIRRTMAQALTHLRSLGYAPGTVVDVGAAHGTDELLEAFPDAFFFWIEAAEEFEPQLQALRARYSGKVVMAAAGPKDGEITFHAHGFLYGSSVLKESDGESADGEERTVRMVDLDHLVEGHDLGRGPLLKIDVQGYELEVLSGAQDLLAQCDVVILETSFFRLHHGAPEFHEILLYMKERGFVAYDIFDGHNRPLDNALAQRDVLFVKENGRFRSSHEWATPEQRLRFSGQ
ncbi:MAG: FkbM family methyltransferase [Flavobacteriales bacterium]|nr:FkbM family methyltransferase [Flavobacteriales bacterium]